MMNPHELYKQVKKTPLDVIDQLDTTINLLLLCEDCLCNSKLTDIKGAVACVLHFVAKEQLTNAQEDLTRI